MIELPAVIDTGIPGRITLRAGFEFSAKSKNKRKVHLVSPEELVHFLSGKICSSRVRRKRSEPARPVTERRDKGKARPALRRSLGHRQRPLGAGKVACRVTNVHQPQP